MATATNNSPKRKMLATVTETGFSGYGIDNAIINLYAQSPRVDCLIRGPCLLAGLLPFGPGWNRTSARGFEVRRSIH
jgi:hypothetical protein